MRVPDPVGVCLFLAVLGATAAEPPNLVANPGFALDLPAAEVGRDRLARLRHRPAKGAKPAARAAAPASTSEPNTALQERVQALEAEVAALKDTVARLCAAQNLPT